jgi:hypothetical protein
VTYYAQQLDGSQNSKEVLYIQLPYSDIKEFHKRWYQLRDTALEIFLITGRTYLVAFNSTKVRYGLVKFK